ncbi:MAG: flavodoxin family protein [Bacteroidaceae bacterium]|jgi:multimeric flavodoxin WrbA|nr:flavodoxin family protein [Bacteroidaceae bacterium]
MKNKIVVLVGSMRKHGNTETLVSEFVRGAEENENEVTVISVADYHIMPCTGCNACRKRVNKDCMIKDDMQTIFPILKEADIIVIASPVYFYGLSARLKAIIDRLHQPARSALRVKKLGLLLVAADTLAAVFDPIKLQYQLILDYFHLENVGEVLAYGVEAVGDIKGKPVLQDAYQLGKEVK